jgi:lipopolysaccharide export system permease protein
MTPLGGMWMSTMVLIPIGIFLIYKAMNDSQLFSNEFYFRSFKAVRERWRQFKKET